MRTLRGLSYARLTNATINLRPTRPLSRSRNFPLVARDPIFIRAESCAVFSSNSRNSTDGAPLRQVLIPDRYYKLFALPTCGCGLSQLQSLTVGRGNFGRTSFADSLHACMIREISREKVPAKTMRAGPSPPFFFFTRFNACNAGQ